ncbi:MobF family relaxase [Streptomyces litmocidini]|uniref:MobF family relaxase n=1 Tax=Streptomyces litmocidini TaxID=67318 RepID=UPI0036FE6DF8
MFGEGRHPHADRLVAEQLAVGKKPAVARRVGALGRTVKVTGMDLVFRPQLTVQLLWALGDEETRRVIGAAHERAIEIVPSWIEDNSAIIRAGAQGRYLTQPVHGLAAACFRHYQSRAGTPLLHDHVLVSLRGLRPDGKWGAAHSTVLFENTVAASSLYNELLTAEVCESLGLTSGPRTASRHGTLRTPIPTSDMAPRNLIGKVGTSDPKAGGGLLGSEWGVGGDQVRQVLALADLRHLTGVVQRPVRSDTQVDQEAAVDEPAHHECRHVSPIGDHCAQLRLFPRNSSSGRVR